MLTEAAIIAISEAIKAICSLVEKAMEGQSPEQKQKLWEWYIHDVEAWRAFWGIKK